MKESLKESSELMKIASTIQKRMKYFVPKHSLEIMNYEFFERGLFTTCILTHRDHSEICGIGNTIKSKKDKYNFKIAMNVSFSKAMRDYISYLMLKQEHIKIESLKEENVILKNQTKKVMQIYPQN